MPFEFQVSFFLRTAKGMKRSTGYLSQVKTLQQIENLHANSSNQGLVSIEELMSGKYSQSSLPGRWSAQPRRQVRNSATLAIPAVEGKPVKRPLVSATLVYLRSSICNWCSGLAGWVSDRLEVIVLAAVIPKNSFNPPVKAAL